nr:vegetative cell wall protein gp1-like [Aegilops tauschii subsp. strangulata]
MNPSFFLHAPPDTSTAGAGHVRVAAPSNPRMPCVALPSPSAPQARQAHGEPTPGPIRRPRVLCPSAAAGDVNLRRLRTSPRRRASSAAPAAAWIPAPPERLALAPSGRRPPLPPPSPPGRRLLACQSSATAGARARRPPRRAPPSFATAGAPSPDPRRPSPPPPDLHRPVPRSKRHACTAPSPNLSVQLSLG